MTAYILSFLPEAAVLHLVIITSLIEEAIIKVEELKLNNYRFRLLL